MPTGPQPQGREPAGQAGRPAAPVPAPEDRPAAPDKEIWRPPTSSPPGPTSAPREPTIGPPTARPPAGPGESVLPGMESDQKPPPKSDPERTEGDEKDKGDGAGG